LRGIASLGTPSPTNMRRGGAWVGNADIRGWGGEGKGIAKKGEKYGVVGSMP